MSVINSCKQTKNKLYLLQLCFICPGKHSSLTSSKKKKRLQTKIALTKQKNISYIAYTKEVLADVVARLVVLLFFSFSAIFLFLFHALFSFGYCLFVKLSLFLHTCHTQIVTVDFALLSQFKTKILMEVLTMKGKGFGFNFSRSWQLIGRLVVGLVVVVGVVV